MKTKKILALALAAVLLVAVSVAGTIAYLQDTTDEVINEFAPHGIDITLEETKDADGEWNMDMIPGTEKSKNPTVTVNTPTTTVPIWVFVKVDETNVPAALEYELNLANCGFEQMDNGIWYRDWDPVDDAADASWHLLVGDRVWVDAETAVAATGGTIQGGSLTFQAWAIQKAMSNVNGTVVNFTAEEAWEQINK